MEGCALEARRITADLRRNAHSQGGAGRKKGQMACIGYHVILGFRRESFVHILRMARMRQDFVVRTAPELDGNLDPGESFRRE